MLSQQSGPRRDSGVGPGADQRGLQRDQPRCTSGDGPAPYSGDGSVNLAVLKGAKFDQYFHFIFGQQRNEFRFRLCVILTKCDSGKLSQIEDLITERKTV